MTRTQLRKAASHLRKFLSRYASHMGRPEVQNLINTYICGLLSDTRKKNAEGIALEVGGGRVRALQRLLSSARWDEDAIVAEHQRAMSETQGIDSGVLVVDDTGFPKQGNCSCGVGRQYSGTLGKVGNCQIGVFLSYVGADGVHSLMDRRLYLKKEWFTPEWAGLRERVRIPEDVVFRTKPELALEMIEGAAGCGVPHAWVSMDAGYGDVTSFLDALDMIGERYVAAVASNTHVWTECPRTCMPRRKSTRGRRPTKRRLVKGARASQRVKDIAAQLPKKAYKTAILRQGEKGPLHVEVAALRVWNRRGQIPGREEWLLIVRRFGQKPDTKYLLSNAPAKTPKMTMVNVGLIRWTEEQCFEQTKDDLGLDHYQTKTWTGWHRHATLTMLAHSFLASLVANGEKKQRSAQRLR
jgi:SRSO17 transposase